MINKNDLHIGQVVEWLGDHQKGVKGKITHLHDTHFTVEWSDGEITDDTYDGDHHNLKIHSKSKVKTLTRTELRQLMSRMYKLGWQDHENKGPFLAVNRIDEVLEKYLQ
jgi:hypothetical protein